MNLVEKPMMSYRTEINFRYAYKNTIFFCVILSVLLTVNFLLPHDYLALLSTFVACIKLFFCKRKELLPLIIYFSFFAYLFRFQNYNIFVFVALSFLTRAALLKRVNLVYAVVWIPIYFFTHLLSSVSLNMNFSIGDLIPLFVVMILIFASGLCEEENKNVYLYFFIVGHIMASFLGLTRNSGRLKDILNSAYVSVNSYQDSLRFSGLAYDPNFYTITAVLTLCILMFGFGYKIKTNRWFFATIITIVFGLITYSKSMLFCFLVILLVSFLKTEKIIRLNVLKTLPFLLGLCIIFHNQLLSIYETIMVRFEEVDSLQSLTTGRSDIWKIYFNDIFKSVDSFFWGNGIVQSFKYAAHNTYLEIIQKFGLIGIVTDFLYLYFCNKKMKGRFNLSMNSIFVVVIFAALLFFLSAYTFFGLWQCIFIVMILTRCKG